MEEVDVEIYEAVYGEWYCTNCDYDSSQEIDVEVIDKPRYGKTVYTSDGVVTCENCGEEFKVILTE